MARSLETKCQVQARDSAHHRPGLRHGEVLRLEDEVPGTSSEHRPSGHSCNLSSLPMLDPCAPSETSSLHGVEVGLGGQAPSGLSFGRG